MKIWIDALTPKQALFFNVIRKWLIKDGHEVFSTTRAGYGGYELGSIINYDLNVVGCHGMTRYDKLIESSKRTEALARVINGKGFNLALSFSSPECARVSYGLGIPHVNFSDSPHAVQASKLTIPLSVKLFSPWVIPKKAWLCYGISGTNIVRYKAIDAAFWIKDWRFKDMKKELNLQNKPTITIRMHEEYASYLFGMKGYIFELIKEVVRNYQEETNIIILLRYKNQHSKLAAEIDGRVIFLDFTVDGPSLIKSSDVFIGLGGTMNHEAALLGVPTISAYPGQPTIVEKFLINKKLIYRPSNLNRCMKLLACLLFNKNLRETYKKRSSMLWNLMHDPRDLIASKLNEIGKKV
ncbi:MAG: DUF354 domain-containing protein [Nitrososphaeria archaeon]